MSPERSVAKVLLFLATARTRKVKEEKGRQMWSGWGRGRSGPPAALLPPPTGGRLTPAPAAPGAQDTPPINTTRSLTWTRRTTAESAERRVREGESGGGGG